MSQQNEKKVALVTGVASEIGIGRACAKLFAANGYQVVGLDCVDKAIVALLVGLHFTPA